jgi:hypothetical protein
MVRNRATTRPRFEIAFGIILGTIALVPMANASDPSLPLEDSYIAYSYALRLATFHGFRLNVGVKPVEAFSDPLWVFLMAIGHTIGLDIPTWSTILNIGLLILIASTTMRLVGRVNPNIPTWISAMAASLVTLVPATAYFAVGGLETLLFMAILNLVLISFLSDYESHAPLSPRTTVLCVLLALTRPEGVLVWIAMWGTTWAWIRQGRSQFAACARYIGPMLLVEVGRLLYFHQLLPNSVVAKSGQPLATSLHLARVELSDFVGHYIPVLIVACLSLGAAIAMRRWLPSARVLAPTFVVLAAFEVVTSSGDNYPFERYLFLCFPGLVAIAVSGLARIGWQPPGRYARHGSARPQSTRARTVSSILVAGTIMGTFVTAYQNLELGSTTQNALNVDRGLARMEDLFRADRLSQHDGLYQYALATYLNVSAPKHSLVAMDEIGVVSYYTSDKVLDLYGLANTHISHLSGAPGMRNDPEYVFGQAPRYIVILTGGCLCAVAPSDAAYVNDPRMLGYRLAATLYTTPSAWGSVRPVSAVLFEKDATMSRVYSLDSEIPSADKVTGPLPATLGVALDQEVPLGRGIEAPTRNLEQAGSLALRSNISIIHSADLYLRIPPEPSRSCVFQVTALSAGSATAGSLIAKIATSTPNAPTLGSAMVAAARASAIDTVTIPLGHRSSLYAELSASPSGLNGASIAMWAEPRVTCRA